MSLARTLRPNSQENFFRCMGASQTPVLPQQLSQRWNSFRPVCRRVYASARSLVAVGWPHHRRYRCDDAITLRPLRDSGKHARGLCLKFTKVGIPDSRPLQKTRRNGGTHCFVNARKIRKHGWPPALQRHPVDKLRLYSLIFVIFILDLTLL